MIVRRSTLAICTALTALAVAAPAQAGHLNPVYQSTITGSGDHVIGEAGSVSVDNASHAFYVTDRTNHRVEKFDADGNFLFMFGDGVNQTTGGNICPATPGDVCRPGQQSSSTFPHFDSPSSISVDNSNGPSKGSVYVGDGSGFVSKFDPTGHIVTSWGTNGVLTPPEGLTSMAVSGTTGYVWVFGNYRFFSFDDKGTQASVTDAQVPYSIGDGQMAVDGVDDQYFQWAQAPAVKVNLKRMDEEYFFPGAVEQYAGEGMYVDPANEDLYVDRGNEIARFEAPCRPETGYCTPKEVFGAGHITGGEGFGVDSATGRVYVAADNGVVYFKPAITPDITVTDQAVSGHTSAVVSGQLDPLGAGSVTVCKVEFGPNKNYGTTVPCDQSVPIADAGEVTATISGLTTESTYHYRFVVGNANGSTNGRDQTATPHWVLNLATGDVTGVGPGGATLHGNLNPNGEATHYYFEWGTTLAYGTKTPAEPGADPGTGTGDTPVSESLDGLLTSETTYHYRLVGYNALGTSIGVDQSFTTPIADFPTIQNPTASKLDMDSVLISGEINPGFGDTSFTVQYGVSDEYGQRTVISQSIGNDGTFHPVSIELPDLSPGTTYHYRIVALNFKGTIQGADAIFTTPDLPLIVTTSAIATGPDAAQLAAQVISNGSSGNPTVHFEYGTNPSYGARTAEGSPLGPSGGTETASLSGLAPGTTYHFRAVATNAFGSTTGPDQTFTTAAAPVIAVQTPPIQCKKGQVRRKGKCVKKPHKRHKHKKQSRQGARG